MALLIELGILVAHIRNLAVSQLSQILDALNSAHTIRNDAMNTEAIKENFEAAYLVEIDSDEDFETADGCYLESSVNLAHWGYQQAVKDMEAEKLEIEIDAVQKAAQELFKQDSWQYEALYKWAVDRMVNDHE